MGRIPEWGKPAHKAFPPQAATRVKVMEKLQVLCHTWLDHRMLFSPNCDRSTLLNAIKSRQSSLSATRNLALRARGFAAISLLLARIGRRVMTFKLAW